MDSIYDMAEVFKMLGDKTRLTILALLKEKDMCVCDIVDLLSMSQSSVSQHLRKMRSAGLIRESRRGQWMYYSLTIGDKLYVQEILAHVPSQKEVIIEFESKKAAAICD